MPTFDDPLLGGLSVPVGTPLSDLISRVLERAGDPDGRAHSRDLVCRLIIEAARLVNAKFRVLVTEEVFTTTASTVFYELSTVLPDAIRIVSISHEGRELPKTPWLDLRHQLVLEASGPPQTWAEVGRDMFALWPSNPVSLDVDVRYIDAMTNDCPSETVTLPFSEESTVLVVDMVEKILLIRARYLKVASAKR